MQYIKPTVLALSLVLFIGCASQSGMYKIIPQSQVSISRTEKGEQILISKVPLIAFQEVIERSPNVKSVTRMTDLRGDREPGFYSISPKSPEIVYQALEVANGSFFMNLWKASTSGSPSMTRLTAGRYFDMEPSHSPSGEDVYFSSNRSSQIPKLFRVKSDGAGGITRLTQFEAEDRSPNISPKSDTAYYMSKPFHALEWQIWSINLSGALPTQFREGQWPKISSNNNKILYSAKDQYSKKLKIWVMNSDGTQQTQLTSDQESDDIHPSWSPTGRIIAFASDMGEDSNGKKNFDIWAMRADGSNLTQLTTNGSSDLTPVFSPDGKFIYFLSNRGFRWDIWRMQVAN